MFFYSLCTVGLQEDLSTTQSALRETQETLRQSQEERASLSKEAASAEAASEELIERLNADNARLEVRTPWAS